MEVKCIDYSTVVHLCLPVVKQLIQLCMFLSLDVQHVLEHKLHLPPDDTCSVDNVLQTLEEHIKGKTNKAVQVHELFSCIQNSGESFSDFYVRLKNAAEAVGICEVRDKSCEETQFKQVILMGSRDKELVQKLITIAPLMTWCRNATHLRPLIPLCWLLQCPLQYVQCLPIKRRRATHAKPTSSLLALPATAVTMFMNNNSAQ